MAEIAVERFLKLQGVKDQERKKEIEETERHRGDVENEISELEKKIEVKEKELEELVKEVEVLQEELIEEAFWIESGRMKKRSRNKAIEGHREKEIQKMDKETLIAEKRREWEKEDLLGEILILDKYIEKYREEEREKRKRYDTDHVWQWQCSKKNTLKLYRTYFFFSLWVIYYFLFLQSNDDDDDDVEKDLIPSTSDNPEFVIDSEEEDDDGEEEKDDDGNLTESYDIEEEGEEVWDVQVTQPQTQKDPEPVNIFFPQTFSNIPAHVWM